jgi:hypothetical protein
MKARALRLVPDPEHGCCADADDSQQDLPDIRDHKVGHRNDDLR